MILFMKAGPFSFSLVLYFKDETFFSKKLITGNAYQEYRKHIKSDPNAAQWVFRRAQLSPIQAFRQTGQVNVKSKLCKHRPSPLDKSTFCKSALMNIYLQIL